MKKVILTVCICILLCSCASNQEVVVRRIVDIGEQTPDFDKVVFVSDTGKQYGKTFEETFVQNIKLLTQDGGRDVLIMTYIEFIRSSYNDPAQKSSFPGTLFVFINSNSVRGDEYGISSVKYQLDVKFLDQKPLLSEEIRVSVFSSLWSSKSEAATEFSNTVFEELHKQNIL